jgi:hypothetical protein
MSLGHVKQHDVGFMHTKIQLTNSHASRETVSNSMMHYESAQRQFYTFYADTHILRTKQAIYLKFGV